MNGQKLETFVSPGKVSLWESNEHNVYKVVICWYMFIMKKNHDEFVFMKCCALVSCTWTGISFPGVAGIPVMKSFVMNVLMTTDRWQGGVWSTGSRSKWTGIRTIGIWLIWFIKPERKEFMPLLRWAKLADIYLIHVLTRHNHWGNSSFWLGRYMPHHQTGVSANKWL